MKKRVLSVLLAIVMVVGMFPVTAGALPAPHTHPVCGKTHTDIGDHTGTCEAVKWTEWDGTVTFPGGNVYLTKDITLTEALTISGTVNLCLNGHSITNSAIAAIAVNSGATLNICDCKGGGSVTNSGGTNSGGTTYGIYNSGTVNVYGGTISATTTATTTTAGSGSGIYNQSGQVTVVGTGAVVSGTFYGIYNNSTNGTVSVSAGKVSGKYGIYNKGKVIVGGEITVTGTDYGISNSGTVSISGGTVTGNGSGIYGYGIYLHSSSTGAVSVSGGTVSGTAYGVYTTGNSSGSVTVSGVANISGAQSGILHYGKGTVTVSGGTVQSPQRVTGTTSSGIKILTGSGNVTVSGGTVSGMDYGIYNGGTLTLSNAPTITGDTADIHLDSGKIITISGALTYTEENAISVKMDSAGTFTSGWTTKMGGNADNYGSYFTSKNEGYTVQPDGNGELKLAEPPAHSHCVCGGTGAAGDHTSCEEITWTEWDGTTDITYTDGTAYVYLSADVSLSGALVVGANQTLYLCLNDHVLDYNGNSASGAITVRDGGVLYLTDCCTAPTTRYGQWNEANTVYTISTSQPDGGSFDTLTGGVITGGGFSANLSSQTYYGGGVWVYNGTFYMYGGTIAGNTAFGTGGGVYVEDGVDGAYGIFYLYDGTITGNRAANGGGIDVFEGTFYMYGGTIAGNTATGSTGGGGVYVSESEFYMSGGSITDNRATANGGGVVLSYSNKSKFNMSGGSITGNSADKNGGGVYAPSSAYITVSGAPKIINNTKGTGDSAPANNLVPESYLRFTVSGTLGPGASIGIFRTAAGRFSAGGADSVSYFSSDNAGYKVEASGENLKLVALHTHNYTYSANGYVITESCTCGHKETATLELDTTVSAVYTGSAIKALKVTYSSGWVGDQNAAISYSNNTNAGTASGSVTIGGLTVTKSFTITKKSAEAPAAPTAQNSITYGAELSEVGLTAGWTWADGNTIPTVNNSGYTAYYTPADVTNLDWTAVDGWNASAGRVERTVAVTVNKSAPTYTAPTGLTATYGDTLANVSLPSGWTWKTPSASVGNAGVNSFKAVFTPDDTDNYDTVEIDVIVTVGKADASYTTPTGLTATYGDTLADVSLPSGWTWKTPSASVGNVGINSFKAVYTPSDTDNFNVAEVDVSVTVGKANSSYTAPTAKELVYNGSTQTLVNAGSTTTGAMQYALGSITEPTGSWSATLPQGQNADTYYIWYKVVGDDNHNDVAPACVAVTIAKKQIAKPAADNSTFTYNGSYQTYAMNGDPAFIIKNNVQKNAGSYTVTVTLRDTANYEWTDGTTTALEYIFKIEQKEIGISWSNTALTYNGAAQRPTATATGVVTGEQIALLLSAPETNAGSYTAMVRGIDGETAQNYKLPAGRSTTFTIEQQALTIVWGNSSFTYDGAEKFPAFNVEGIWNADDVQVTKEGAQTNAGEYTAQIIGLTGSDAGNYKLTGTLTKDFVINKADQAAPAVNKVDETISGKNDGKITDVAANMEYRAEGEDRYTAITGETVENLADGKYYVRVKGDSNHNPSADTAVVIGAGRMLTVTVPQNQVGYTMITTTPEVEYFGSIRVEFKLLDGYSMTDSFQIYNGTDPVGFSLMGDTYVYGLNFVNSDFNFTVSGVADITAPLAQIDIKNNKWTSFWNGVTFGLFFNETQDVTITAADAGSGVNTIQYYLAGGELELDEVKQIPVWQDYSSTFQIDPDNAYVVYVKVTDNAGNVSYLNSDGVVLDQTVPVLVGIENNGSYYGDQCFKALDDYLDALKVDGVDVTDEMNADNEYTIVADNAEHIVTATDKAGNATEYKITVFKNYTVTYKVDGNTVSTQTVGHGKDATAPTIPEKEGYTQTAPVWDKDGTNITADTEINAVYTINKYTVTYKADGNVVGTVEVEHGKDAAAPAIPEKEGYTKTAPVWDKDGKNITADTEINAVYTINEYTITFKDENGVYKTLTVKHGEAVTMPEVPAKDGYTVTWDTTIEKATDNATVNAVYTKNAVSDNPQTGDNSNLWLWWILLIVSAFGITVICIEQKKRKAMR